MRKTKKKRAREYVRLLDKAHEAVRKAIETRNTGIAMELLEECQDAAIQLGGLIEESEGENFSTISILEDYCELVYQIHEAVREDAKADAGRFYKRLHKFSIQIENSINNEIATQTEAVFLPYKASMWDSLESVWKAADEDPDCSAYVIPIPYYDKNPDGSFGEAHYEGDQYPAYVPVTDYNSYDFEERRPDIIFVHNPYDQYNRVTSVHPFFYTSNLKKFTDKLVYIPYYILDEIDPDNHEAVDGVKHFCTVPGVVNADKVIVQSKGWRQIYINVMTAEMGEGTRSIWEEKILGLGSPKVDKVLGTRIEDIEIPEEWRRIIDKPDGSRRKIIFYNTCVTALLQHGEKMLRKMEQVFETFKENQEEVALLWRPHPLVQATIESMRPQLWEEYRELVEKYREEGWGIYDDTPDMNRAIVLSDGYYGDASSIVQLYEKTGKPIMMQDVEVLNE